jgi:HAMP domain-containing protein
MTTARRVRGSGFARRLLAVFVVCTLLPLAVSDGLATFALAELAEALEGRQQVRTTRQVALQVYDRLLAARATLLVLPAGPDAVGAGPSPQPLGAAQMFRALVRPQGADDPCQVAEPLLVAWCAATDGRTPRPEGEHAAGAMAATSLRTLVGADGAVRLLVARGDPARPAWLAELDPAHVFAPLAESGSTLGHAWRVTDAGGRVLAALGNASDAHEGASSGGGTAHLHATSLFLDSDFAAADWTFESWRGPAELDRHGVPLGAWLALVAAAAALASLFLGTRFLRRLLGPLRSLTDGTRALAAGDPTARVVPAGDDEIAALGHAFNDMADRIDGQIRSLELLAAIDRDVLVGTSLETVVRRVIDGVVALHALPAVGVVWRLGIRHAGWCSVVREAAGATVTGRPPCPLDVLDAAAEPAGSLRRLPTPLCLQATARPPATRTWLVRSRPPDSATGPRSWRCASGTPGARPVGWSRRTRVTTPSAGCCGSCATGSLSPSLRASATPRWPGVRPTTASRASPTGPASPRASTPSSQRRRSSPSRSSSSTWTASRMPTTASATRRATSS